MQAFLKSGGAQKQASLKILKGGAEPWSLIGVYAYYNAGCRQFLSLRAIIS